MGVLYLQNERKIHCSKHEKTSVSHGQIVKEKKEKKRCPNENARESVGNPFIYFCGAQNCEIKLHLHWIKKKKKKEYLGTFEG